MLRTTGLFRLISLMIVLCMISGCGKETKPVVAENSPETLELKTMLNEPEILYEKEEMLPGILVDRIGYETEAEKLAIFQGDLLPGNFIVVDKSTGKNVYTGRVEMLFSEETQENWGVGDFSELKTNGEYYIEAELLGKSLDFKITDELYSDIFIFANEGLSSLMGDTTITEHVTLEDTPDKKIEISGGWYTGDNGERDVVEGCLAVLDIVKAYEYFPEVFSDTDSNNRADILDEIKAELIWLMKMQNPETGGVYASVSYREDETPQLVIVGETTRATAYYCAAMASSSIVFARIDKALSEECIKAAGLAWNCLEANSELVGRGQRFRAAAEMYKATGMPAYSTVLSAYLSANADAGFSERIELDGAMTYMSTNRSVNLDYCTTLMQHFMSDVEDIAGSARYSKYLVKEETDDLDLLLRDAFQLTEADYIITSKEYGVIERNYLHYLCGRNPDSIVYVDEINKPDAYAQLIFILSKIENK